MAFQHKPQVAEHLQRVLVVFRHVHPDAVQLQAVKGFVQHGYQGRRPIVMVPEVLASNQDEQLGLFKGPLHQQLTLADVGFLCCVD